MQLPTDRFANHSTGYVPHFSWQLAQSQVFFLDAHYGTCRASEFVMRLLASPWVDHRDPESQFIAKPLNRGD